MNCTEKYTWVLNIQLIYLLYASVSILYVPYFRSPRLVSDSTIVVCVSLYVVVVGLLQLVHLDVCFVRGLLTEVLIVLDVYMYEFGRPHSSCALRRSIQNVVCGRELLRG